MSLNQAKRALSDPNSDTKSNIYSLENMNFVHNVTSKGNFPMLFEIDKVLTRLFNEGNCEKNLALVTKNKRCVTQNLETQGVGPFVSRTLFSQFLIAISRLLPWPHT